MASDPGFVAFLADQFAKDLRVTSRLMFGDYGLFSDGRVFALVCDNQLFMKPTEGGRAFIGDVVEAPAYPGARPSLLITDRLEDGEWLSELARITVRELPAKKPKKPKKPAVKKPRVKKPAAKKKP